MTPIPTRAGRRLLLCAAIAALACRGSQRGSRSEPTQSDDSGESGPDDLAATLEPVRARAELPALAAAVWRGSALIAVGATGVRKRGDRTPVTAADRWHLGSDTKAMTATLIGIHVDRGRIRFEDTIGELFAGETIDPGYKGVTLEQLLWHRGGAPGEIPMDIRAAMRLDGSEPGARTKAVLALLARPPAQPPGTFAYANAGYMIAGVALERRAGATWEELMRKDLFEPLGMTSCGFGAPGTAAAVDQPWGHLSGGGDAPVPVAPGPNADNPPSLGPAGTVHCSLADWGKFLAVHLASARREKTALLSVATLTRLQTPPADGDYAAGWRVVERPWAGGLALTHSGSNTMWFATVWVAPGHGMIYAVVANSGGEATAAAVDSVFAPLVAAYPR